MCISFEIEMHINAPICAARQTKISLAASVHIIHAHFNTLPVCALDAHLTAEQATKRRGRIIRAFDVFSTPIM
jgi:hypothetical protein